MITDKKRRSTLRFAAMALTCSLLANLFLNIPILITHVSAQTTNASVGGYVVDEQGNAVSKAKVSAKNILTNISRAATSDGDGRYLIPQLSPGTYEITVEREGFRLVIQKGVELTVGREAVLNFKLNVGNLQEKVLVEEDAGLVETTNSAVTNLINTRQIEQLPLNGRNVLQLATLGNGVLSASGITDVQSNVGAGTTLLVVNGGRLEYNGYLLDGTETSDAFGYSPGGLGGFFLGVDALREFQVLTSGYSAEYGHAGGAIINAVTKSGTNDIHGTAFEFIRNSSLDARNFFDQNPRQLPFQRNQFGGSLGGPIIKDRAFLFANYEGLRRREGVPVRFNVPTQAAKQGNLTMGQFPVSPLIAPYLALYPNPDPNGLITGDTGIFTRNFKEMTREDFGTIRADYKLTGSQSLAARYTVDDSELTKVGGVIQNLVLDQRNQYVSLEEQAVIGARGVNSIRGTYNRSNFNSAFPFVDANGNIVNLDPSLSFIAGRPLGGFSIPGVSPLRDILTDNRSFVLNQFEVNDQFVYTLGSQSLKIGGSVRRYQLNADSANLKDGVFFFNPRPDSNVPTQINPPLVQFLAASPDFLFATLPGTDNYRGIRQSLFGLYVQDDWKVTRRLTLNLGARYEPISTPTAENGKVSNLRNPTDVTSTPGDPYIDNPSYKNIAPRVGFALDVFGDGRTSLRASAGLFHAQLLPMRYRFELSNLPPFAQLSAVVGPFPNPFSNPMAFIPAGVAVVLASNADQPRIYQWNLNIQRELGRDFVLSAGYVGSRGTNLETRNSINVRTDSQIVNGRKFFPAVAPSQVQGLLLNPNFQSIQYHDFSADSYYNALQLNVSKRFSSGLQFQTAYTFSKSLDTASTTESVFQSGASNAGRQDPFDSGSERALSDYDARHNFVANYLYDLPFGKGRLIGGDISGVVGVLIGGWSTGGIFNARSGFPFNVSLGFDQAGNNTNNSQAQRPDVAPGVDLSDATTDDPAGYVNPAFFQLQPAGFYGNASRNSLRGPKLYSFDMTFTKLTPINERFRTEFRVEAFNLFNRANFAPPNAVNNIIFLGVGGNGVPIPNQNFGQLSRTVTSSRQLQFGLKLLW
jgi:carboxypeptidase family protein/TonB-dependent receptor-like protein